MGDDTWNRIWDERGREYPDDDAIKIAGYDQAFSRMTPEGADRLAERVAGQLALTADDALLDLGCGAGMLLARLAPRVRAVYGTDRAEGMVERARRLNPGFDVRVAEAAQLPFGDATFDKVLVHGVVQYFPDEAYVRTALDEAVRVTKPGGRVLLGDVMDRATKDAYLAFRASQAGSGGGWTSSVKDAASHLYLERGFFADYAARKGIRCAVSDRDVPGYLNANFRFDVTLDV
jgi:SAM-dependent methyltransferase